MTAAMPGRTLWRFASVGVVNTFAGLAFIYIARGLGLGEVAANATGYAVGLVISFVLNRRWTFEHRGPVLARALRFAMVMLLAWLANLVVLLGLLHGGVTAALAQAAAVLPYAVVSYLGCRWWVFSNRIDGLEDRQA